MEPKQLTRNWSRKRRFFVKFILLFISLVAALTVTEIALRIINYSFPTFYSADEFRGYVLTPRIEGWYLKEGESYVRINGDGLRDTEHSKQKPANTLRSIILLTLLFYLAFVPYNPISRIIGRDPLQRRGKTRASNWTERKTTRQKKDRFERLF